MGTQGLFCNLATCCNPMPGDSIIGYVTRGRGVTVHRADCSNVLSMSSADIERLTEVAWEATSEEQKYSVPIEITSFDREGLLKEVATIIAEQKVNISELDVSTKEQVATMFMTLDISDHGQLTRILAQIETLPDVVEAHRRHMT